MELAPPSDARLEEATGLRVVGRRTLRRTALSLAERLKMKAADGTGRGAVLKTACPALAHEGRAYGLLRGFDICAAELLACGPRDADADAWLLLEDLGEGGTVAAEPEVVGPALEALARMHRAYLGKTAALAGIPRRDPQWMAENAAAIGATLHKLRRERGLDLDGGVLAAFERRLRDMAGLFPAGRLSLVHGDFDPGNLHPLPGGGAGALDWGLAHIGTPWIDLAHMVERFAPPARLELARRFIGALGAGCGTAPEDAVFWGAQAHRAFFVWWHSLVVVRGWDGAEGYLGTIAARVRAVAAASA